MSGFDRGSPDAYCKWFRSLSCCEKAAWTGGPCHCREDMGDAEWRVTQAGTAGQIGPPPEFDRDLMVDLYAQGLTQREVADRVGCAESTVGSVIRAAGVSRGTGKKSLGKAGKTGYRLPYA